MRTRFLSFIFAIISWVVPFFVSAFFIDPNTKSLTVNPIIFHGILIALFTILVFFSYRYLAWKKKISIITAHVFVGTNIILDMIILLWLFKAMSMQEWWMTIAPVYIIVSYVIYFLTKKIYA